jgi:hypothetical protein
MLRFVITPSHVLWALLFAAAVSVYLLLYRAARRPLPRAPEPPAKEE